MQQSSHGEHFWVFWWKGKVKRKRRKEIGFGDTNNRTEERGKEREKERERQRDRKRSRKRQRKEHRENENRERKKDNKRKRDKWELYRALLKRKIVNEPRRFS